MKVNLIAYAIEENRGSESGSGWASLRAHLANDSSVRVFTTQANKKLFEKSSLAGNLQIEIVASDPPFVDSIFFTKLPFSTQIKYHLWVFKIGSLLRTALKTAGANDVVHHVTYAGDWNISPILLVPRNQKSFWGPIGGCQGITGEEFIELDFKGKIVETIRKTILSPTRLLIRSLVSRRNITILTMNGEVTDYFTPFARALYCPNLAIDMKADTAITPQKYIFSSGRLIPLKNFKLLIEAMLHVAPEICLIIAGEGFLRKKLEKQIVTLGLTDRVRLIGEVPRDVAIELLVNCTVFAFTSIRDSHSWSLAEAVHFGIPVATIGTPGNLAVLQHANPSYLPRRKVTALEFAEYLDRPVKFDKQYAFSIDNIANYYEKIFRK